jgi:hypothetical protein
MNRIELSAYIRSLLSRGFSVADEEGALDGKLRLVVVRRGADEVLIVELSDAWFQSLGDVLSTEDRMLLKHLAICIRRYFSHPEALPEPAIRWPGTSGSRQALRLALDPRRRRR